MTDSANLTAPLTSLAKGIWWWVLIRGILALAFGIIALIAPGAALNAIAIVFGAYALVDGILTAVQAIQVRNSFAPWGWLLAQGVLSALAGIVALILPGIVGAFGGLVVIWTIVIWNIVHGVAGIRSAAGASDGSSKTWGIIAGVLSILFGVILGIVALVNPGAGLLGLIWVVGIYAVIFGIILIVTAIQLRVAVSGAIKNAAA